MTDSVLEHVNITVSDPDKTASMLCEVFGWYIRWQGDAIDGGRTIHVGSDACYLAIYSPKKTATRTYKNYESLGGLNHVGIVVDNLAEIEARVIANGLKPGSHFDYEPGRRFYFNDGDGVEFEVICYA